MTTLQAIDCQGFAGGFTLGTVQAGWQLVGKREHPAGFGVVACENNRHLLGYDWKAEASDPVDWTPYDVPYVFGNPPCSGFSLMSHRDFRGPDSPINSCMWDFTTFAARCRAEIMVFESVSQAFKQGRELMQALRANVERITGQQYHLTHLLHNNYALGGAAIRKRYFFVCHRVPFGVDRHTIRRVPLLHDVISDLEGMSDTWQRQAYRRPPTWWSRSRRSPSGAVDGHVTRHTPGTARLEELLLSDTGWDVRTPVSKALTKYWEAHHDLPPSWRELKSYDKLLAAMPEPDMGFHQAFRWSYERAARVVTGSALDMVIHPTEPRLITHREALRIQGFPDDWTLREIASNSKLQALWGKGIPVDCGRWVSGCVRRSLEGSPGDETGELIGERESLIDLLRDYWHLSTER